MKKELRFRFWLEAGLATLAGLMFLGTLIWSDWIEIVLGVDPDSGNGSVERLIVMVLIIATTTLSVLVRFEWRAARTITE